MIDDEFQLDHRVRITGTMVAYFFICRRKLWLFARGLNLENVSGNADVIKGRILHETRFKRESDREMVFDTVKIDFLRFQGQIFIHEIKKSKKFEEAHLWQLKYYIYFLQKQGINCMSGVIHYPSSMRKVEVTMEENDAQLIKGALKEIAELIKNPVLPKCLNKKMCLRCAYFDFCYA